MRSIVVAIITLMLVAPGVRLQASAAPTPLPSASPTATPDQSRGSLAMPNALPVAGKTVIHPSDQLSIQVFGDQTLSQNVTVLADGTIDYPLIGRVKVAGKTPYEAAELLTDRLHTYVRHPVVNVSISQLGSIDVLVLGGDVKNPGKYSLRSDARVTDALAAAGGLANTNGAFPAARVADSSGNVQEVSLENLLQHGDTALDHHLSEGAVVYVPGPIQFNVDVAGAVDHPGEIQINQGDRLSAAIAKAGDSQAAQSDLNHIRLIRTVDGKPQTTEINLYEALQGGNENADVVLQKGDVIYVPETYQHRTDIASTAGTGLIYILSRLLIP